MSDGKGSLRRSGMGRQQGVWHITAGEYGKITVQDRALLPYEYPSVTLLTVRSRSDRTDVSCRQTVDI